MDVCEVGEGLVELNQLRDRSRFLRTGGDAAEFWTYWGLFRTLDDVPQRMLLQ